MRKIAAMAACGLLVACLAGCQSPGPISTPLTTSPDEPNWVSLGGRAFPEDAGKAFYGVGIAAANRFPDDPFMLRRTAADDGLTKIGKQLDALVAAVLKDYSAAAFTPGLKPEELERMTGAVQKSVKDQALLVEKTAASWKDSQTGDMYVLIKLSLADAAQPIRDQIGAVEKGYLKLPAAAAQKELDGIIEKDRKPAK
jgi:hypothetical protein